MQAFHPAVAAWFTQSFTTPTPAQAEAWPAIRSGRHALIAAPTGSGKTLAAFLAAIDGLVCEGVAGSLTDQVRVVYVSPLKALSNDIAINLEAPIAGIRAELARLGHPDVDIRTDVRTGDTPPAARQRMLKRPPHILVTTPESLYVLLGSESGRALLASTRSVIVDEIHAVAGGKRGAHLSLSLERLQALCAQSLLRIGLSATQKPLSAVARFLVGNAGVDPPGGTPADCVIVDVGHVRPRDLAIEVPPVALEAVMSADVWGLVYNRLAELVQEHRTTLVFVNTRRMAERAARHLAERLGKHAVAAHHGSLAKELRLEAERRLKAGELRVLIATASLELGIDIGDVDLVCQLGSPHAIAAFLQRVGRSGHAMGAIPKGRLFPQSRDDLIECTALLDCVRRGELDALKIPRAPLDVLAQQIVAEVASREWDETELFTLLRRAAPYAELSQADYSAVIGMLAEGFSTRLGNRAAYLHRDAVHGRLRGRRSARLTALTAGGTIADNADYAVVLEPQSLTVGSVHEDFAVESLAGDVFQLGNTSYRILRVERDRIRVEDAHGAPPSMPFWLGEAPGRSDELSFAVSRLRGDISAQLQHGNDVAQRWLIAELGLGDSAASQIIDYLARAKAALGVLPTLTELAMERFFDESGGTQLIIHSPYGSRINKAWGLALRKRFCRSFNFELQAAATEDAIVLSLSTSHSFPLEEVARYLHSATASDVLVQALLDAPLFGVRWRWAATTALALPRYSGGKKVAPQLQRMKSEDLLACVFPDQVACQENIVGERQIPVHPLVAQTLHDCLTEAMDLPGWLELLRGLESGRVRMVARDLPQPSPLAAEILCAQPYAFLDDAPLEERRSHAVSMRRWSDPQSADALGQLDSDAIAAVRAEAAPQARDADEMHEVLLSLTVLPEVDVDAHADWAQWLQQLANSGRATRMAMGASGAGLWCAAERLGLVRHVFADAPIQPPITIPAGFEALGSSREAAIVELLRGRLAILGPAEVTQLAISLMLPAAEIEIALLALEREGYVMRGRFTPHTATDEWCERHLLARIHRYTVQRLRREIEPVEPRDFMRFLFDWQHVGPSAALSGPDAVAAVITQLEGFEAAAGAWESDILSARVSDYSPSWLDDLCRSGRVVWSRLRPSSRDTSGGGPVRATPIVLLPRRSLPLWSACTQAISIDSASLSSRAAAVLQQLSSHGASFFDELATAARLLDSELEDALGELVARGMINADSFAGLRALLTPASRRRTRPMRRHRHALLLGIADAGRWSLLRAPPAEAAAPAAANQALDAEALEHIARSLLRRYGVVCWRLLAREAAWLPPWRELARVYQRLEARGELRGGRFVAGVSGEQFALPEAIPLLRRARGQERSGHLVALSGADPLNLVGIVGAGTRLPALSSTRLVYRDGVLAAHVVAGKVTVDESLQAADAQLVRQALLIERARRVALT